MPRRGALLLLASCAATARAQDTAKLNIGACALTVEDASSPEIVSTCPINGVSAGGSGSGPTTEEFNALVARVAALEGAAMGTIMPSAPAPPAAPVTTPEGNFLLPEYGVIAGGDTGHLVHGAGGQDGDCGTVSVDGTELSIHHNSQTGNPGYAYATISGDNFCTTFAENDGDGFTIIFKFPEPWTIGKLFLLRGIWSGNYAVKGGVKIYTYSGDTSSYNVDENGNFDGDSIPWSDPVDYTPTSTPPLEGDACGGGNLHNEAANPQGKKYIDNLDITADMVKLKMYEACTSSQIAMAQIKMCKTPGDAACDYVAP